MSKKKLPLGWVEVSLGSAFLIERGGSPRPIQDYLTDKDDGINWIKIGDTSTDSKYITSAKEKIIQDGVKKSRMVFEGDFLLSNSMSFGRPYISKIRGCIHDGWLVIRKNDKVENDYLYYVLKSPQCYNQFSLLAKGSTVKNLNIQAVSKVIIPLPPLPEQQRIVAKLDALFGHLDSLREKLDGIPALLKNFRQQVLTQAVTGELIQEEMEIVSLGEYLEDIKYGTSQKSEYGIEGVPILRIPNIDVERGEISVSDMKYSILGDKEYDKLKLKKGDLLIIRSNGSVTLVGQSAIIGEEEVDFGYAGYLVRLRTTNMLDPIYLNYILKSNYLRGQIVEMARSTSGVNNINTTEIKSLKIPLTSTQNQKRIIDQIKIIFAVADKIESQYASLKAKIDQLPQAILAKAFRGELVRQKVKEYVVEEIEGLMAAEPAIKKQY